MFFISVYIKKNIKKNMKIIQNKLGFMKIAPYICIVIHSSKGGNGSTTVKIANSVVKNRV